MEQYLNDAYHVCSIMVSRQQSALAWSVKELALQAAGSFYSPVQLQHYTKQMEQLFQEGK